MSLFTCLLVFLCSKGDTTLHCSPQSSTLIHHPHYGTTVNVTAVLVNWWALTGNRLRYIQDPIQLHGLLMLMFISIWWEMNDLTSFLTHNILNLHIVLVTLWAFPGRSMSIVCCLLCSKYTDLIHHRCLWYTCCTIGSKICLWICAGWHTSAPRNCITALWSSLDRFTTSCDI
jgi:hypothetical protein